MYCCRDFEMGDDPDIPITSQTQVEKDGYIIRSSMRSQPNDISWL